MSKNNGRILRNILCFSSAGKCPQIPEGIKLSKGKCEPEKPPTWKGVLEKCRDVQVALLGVDLEIAKLRGEAGVSVTEAPEILGDPEFFQEPEDSADE